MDSVSETPFAEPPGPVPQALDGLRVGDPWAPIQLGTVQVLDQILFSPKSKAPTSRQSSTFPGTS